MTSARCPLCRLNNDVRDEYANSIQCSSCGHTIYLGEFDPGRVHEERRTRRRRNRTPLEFFLYNGFQILGLAVPFFIGLLLLPLAFLGPVGYILAAGGGGAIFVFAYVTNCILCGHAGDRASLDGSFDSGSSLSLIRWPVLFYLLPFLLFYLVLYLANWSFIHVRQALDHPIKYLPWLALQAYGLFIVAAALVAGFTGVRWP